MEGVWRKGLTGQKRRNGEKRSEKRSDKKRKKVKEKKQFAKGSCVIHIGSTKTNMLLCFMIQKNI